jgi:PAS domain S-box-containing protein
MRPFVDQLQTIIDSIPVLAGAACADGSAEFFNKPWLDFTGLSAEKARGTGWMIAIHPEDVKRLRDYWRTILHCGEPGEIEARIRRFDGVYRWFLFRATPSRDDERNITKWFGTNADIEDGKRSEALLNAEKRILELVASDASLADVLNELCTVIDSQVSGVISTILLMDCDEQHLWHGAGPRFPEALKPVISPWAIGPGRGACGAAAFPKERVIISDLATDPRWPDEFREVAATHGLRAAWAEPLLSASGAVLGTFALYYGEPQVPNEEDIALVGGMSNIARIAIEREQSRSAVAKALDIAERSAGQLRSIIDALPTLAWSMRPDGSSTISMSSGQNTRVCL